MTPPASFSRKPSQIEMVEAHLPVAIDQVRGLDEGWYMPVATLTAVGIPARALEGMPSIQSHFGIRGAQSNHALAFPLQATVPGNDSVEPVARLLEQDVCSILPQDLELAFSPTDQHRFAHIYFTESYLAWVGQSVMGDRNAGRTALRHDRAFAVDPVLRQSAAGYVARALSADGKPSRLEMDSRANLIAMHLLTHHSGTPAEAPRAKVSGGLSGWQARRTTEFLRANMTEDVSLAQLAGMASLSVFHFARAFKQTVGMPPHRYQLRLRLERAQTLLSTTDMTITDIAAAVGYDTPQTLARLFRRETGMSPGQYRRERR